MKFVGVTPAICDADGVNSLEPPPPEPDLTDDDDAATLFCEAAAAHKSSAAVLWRLFDRASCGDGDDTPTEDTRWKHTDGDDGDWRL